MYLDRSTWGLPSIYDWAFFTAQKMKFSIKESSHLLKKSLMENSFFSCLLFSQKSSIIMFDMFLNTLLTSHKQSKKIWNFLFKIEIFFYVALLWHLASSEMVAQ